MPEFRAGSCIAEIHIFQQGTVAIYLKTFNLQAFLCSKSKKHPQNLCFESVNSIKSHLVCKSNKNFQLFDNSALTYWLHQNIPKDHMLEQSFLCLERYHQ